MKNIASKIQEFINNLYELIIRHRAILFIVLSGIILSIILLDIMKMSSANPTDMQTSEAEKSVKIIQFKKESIAVIDSLKESNITIDTLFEPGRYDPFAN
jgi:hypothetical protein